MKPLERLFTPQWGEIQPSEGINEGCNVIKFLTCRFYEYIRFWWERKTLPIAAITSRVFFRLFGGRVTGRWVCMGFPSINIRSTFPAVFTNRHTNFENVWNGKMPWAAVAVGMWLRPGAVLFMGLVKEATSCDAPMGTSAPHPVQSSTRRSTIFLILITTSKRHRHMHNLLLFSVGII